MVSCLRFNKACFPAAVRFGLFAFSMLLGAFLLPVAAEDGPALDFALAAETEAAGMIVVEQQRWSMGNIRDISRTINTLPEPVAIRLLWEIASASGEINTAQVTLQALSSSSPVVRRQAADILISANNPEMIRHVVNRLVVEEDPAVQTYIVNGLASFPSRQAIPKLVQVMLVNGTGAEAVKTAAVHLRRLTRANLPETPRAWRDWWLDNSFNYD